MKPIPVLNIPFSRTIDLALSGFFSMYAEITMTSTQIKNTIIILSINGISGVATFRINENTNVPRAASKAPFAVALFQKNPRRKIARAPGLTNPVNS